MRDLILALEFCNCHHIEISFINSLHKSGLIEITTIKEDTFIHRSQLLELEKMVHLHYELDINIEGIETIIHLLGSINDMQNNILELENRLRLFE